MQDIIKPLELSPGLFFIVEFSAKGGVVYKRIGEETKDVRPDESMTAEYSTRKEVDHIGLQTWSRKIIASAYNIMDRHCTHTPVGYWISEDKAPAMLEALAGCRMEARKLNDFAKTVYSSRRVLIDAYAMQVGQEALEKTAVRLAQIVRERLEALRDDLVRGDLSSYITSWKRAKNLPRLATGLQSEVIIQALEAAKTARGELAEKLKNKQAPESAGRELNFDMLESAITLFTDSVNGTLATVEDSAVG